MDNPTDDLFENYCFICGDDLGWSSCNGISVCTACGNNKDNWKQIEEF